MQAPRAREGEEVPGVPCMEELKPDYPSKSWMGSGKRGPLRAGVWAGHSPSDSSDYQLADFLTFRLQPPYSRRGASGAGVPEVLAVETVCDSRAGTSSARRRSAWIAR
jgi:hypothetical protein